MIYFEKPSSSPTSFYIVTLSNGQTVYEHNNLLAWKELVKYCNEKNLSITNFLVQDNTGNTIKMYRNHARFYFVIRSVAASLKGSGSFFEYKKGYGITAEHPGNLRKTYIRWYNNDDGKFLNTEVIPEIQEFYETDIGVRHGI